MFVLLDLQVGRSVKFNIQPLIYSPRTHSWFKDNSRCRWKQTPPHRLPGRVYLVNRPQLCSCWVWTDGDAAFICQGSFQVTTAEGHVIYWKSLRLLVGIPLILRSWKQRASGALNRPLWFCRHNDRGEDLPMESSELGENCNLLTTIFGRRNSSLNLNSLLCKTGIMTPI